VLLRVAVCCCVLQRVVAAHRLPRCSTRPACMCGAVCCSVLQCVAACCCLSAAASRMPPCGMRMACQRVEECCRMLQSVTFCTVCSILYCVAVYCSVLQPPAKCRSGKAQEFQKRCISIQKHKQNRPTKKT